MHIQIKGSQYDFPRAVAEYARKKVEGLRKYTGRKGEEEAYAYFDLGKASGAHHTGRIWRADISIDLRGLRFHASALGEHIEEAIDSAVAEVGREVKENRAKQHHLMRHGGALAKMFLRGA